MNQIKNRSIESLIPYVNNARTHSDEQVAMIAASLREFGWTNPILIDSEGGVIAGHGRLLAARKILDAGASAAHWDDPRLVPVLELSHMTDAQKRAYVIADNKLAERAGWDTELLCLELGGLRDDGFDLGLIGFDPVDLDSLLGGADIELGGDGSGSGAADSASESLADRFMIPPFSVLNAREGWWQERKRAWLAMGINSADGRDDKLTYSNSAKPPAFYELRNQMRAVTGVDPTWDEVNAEADKRGMLSAAVSGTSIFDPVLCELAYRWFSPVGGLILDPFSGGSVRGIVAAKLGRQYVGCDLRPEQIQANRDQWDRLCGQSAGDDNEFAPVWHCGDSRQIDKHASGTQADLVFSCPPYADLEVYSEDPSDLSTMSYADFLAAYREIIAKSVAMLKPDRFACFVVGDVRDKKGFYYNFVGDTVQAFVDAAAQYYNEGILVTQAGSLAIRAGRTFAATRKLGKTHQNILVFCKGDPKRATEACGVVDVSGLEELDQE
ncbi:MAG: site-specific DNA-methyltransferase [Moraxellaceae bacterium]